MWSDPLYRQIPIVHKTHPTRKTFASPLPRTRYNGPDSLGDGFGYLLPNATDTIRAILAAPINDTAVRVPASQISGVNVWALNQVASLGEFTVEYYVFRLNPQAWASGDKIRQVRLLVGWDTI